MNTRVRTTTKSINLAHYMKTVGLPTINRSGSLYEGSWTHNNQ